MTATETTRRGGERRARISLCALALAAAVGASAQKSVPAPVPPPFVRVADVRADERPVEVSSQEETVADNGLYRRVETTLTFTNPNGRAFEGELEFPLPAGATVCGYALEVNGALVPGVVCAKEAARVAFENERRKGVDPGVVEHVKGNVWRTRIYPLLPKTPRRARVAYIAESPAAATNAAPRTVVERDGADVFVGTRVEASDGLSRADRLRAASEATILWDASLSRHGKAAADRSLLECLPETGRFTLVVFRNVVEAPQAFSARADLLKAVDALVYDGSTCLAEAQRLFAGADVFLFTDEIDVEADARRRVRVRRLGRDEKPPQEPVCGTLLATAWAADFIADRAADAASNRQAFLDLGRRYGVASPVTSLLVLETLEQYLAYKVEPPATMGFHAEWTRRRAAEDDAIAAKKARAEHERRLLALWEARVTWWNDPIPKKPKPSSGLFGGVARALGLNASARAAAPRAPTDGGVLSEEAVSMEGEVAPASAARVASASARKAKAAPASAAPASAAVTLAAWDPKTPYLKAIRAVAPAAAYGEYLRQRAAHGASPAFFLDCAGHFFAAKERVRAVRILSNLAEMKLEDAGLWRTMGWRLREAAAYDEAVAAFRHVLEMRGEEAQSRRDLALVLAERGKLRAASDAAAAARDLAEAMRLLHAAAFEPAARRSARRSNDLQTCVVALEELNGLIAWTAARAWPGVRPEPPAMDAAYRRDLPLDLRIVLSWDADETDVDLHVLEPDGEEAFYGNRRTSSGGFVSEDVTTGYGPEEYLRKTATAGVYKVLAHYYGSHRQRLTGAVTVTATVYTHWGRRDETREVLSFRLDRPKDRQPIGEVAFGR